MVPTVKGNNKPKQWQETITEHGTYLELQWCCRSVPGRSGNEETVYWGDWNKQKVFREETHIALPEIDDSRADVGRWSSGSILCLVTVLSCPCPWGRTWRVTETGFGNKCNSENKEITLTKSKDYILIIVMYYDCNMWVIVQCYHILVWCFDHNIWVLVFSIIFEYGIIIIMCECGCYRIVFEYVL